MDEIIYVCFNFTCQDEIPAKLENFWVVRHDYAGCKGFYISISLNSIRNIEFYVKVIIRKYADLILNDEKCATSRLTFLYLAR